jgi:hypothetical protein
MGGKKDETRNLQMDTARTQNQVMKEMLDFSRARTSQMDTLMKPSIDFFTSLAGGDKTAMNTTLAPQTASITKSFTDAKNNIMDSVAPGAAREFTMGNLERDKANATAMLPTNAFLQSIDALAKIGQGQGNFGLQQLGAGMRAGEGSAATAGAVQQADAQRKAAQMGLLGQVAGAAGYATGMKLG